ncbi:hypothetical protein ZIOFF_054568 [Zingiber officinale]|uniref:Uncharacterized protein n=1 Tax=Zingiber officinale TaxID=94328 RepID=A0A8J5FK93_ZINOF|nr:hypothetical protein ZIOFF_054568 [Zingiber officinale]
MRKEARVFLSLAKFSALDLLPYLLRRSIALILFASILIADWFFVFTSSRSISSIVALAHGVSKRPAVCCVKAGRFESTGGLRSSSWSPAHDLRFWDSVE